MAAIQVGGEQQAPTVIINQTIGLDPVQMKCPTCQANIVTEVHYENGLLTYLISGGLCLFGFVY